VQVCNSQAVLRSLIVFNKLVLLILSIQITALIFSKQEFQLYRVDDKSHTDNTVCEEYELITRVTGDEPKYNNNKQNDSHSRRNCINDLM